MLVPAAIYHSRYAANLKQGITDLQKRVDKMKNGAERDRLQAALGAMGTENDGNNVNVKFGPTGDGAAARTNPFFNEQTGKLVVCFKQSVVYSACPGPA
jgi:hypothetical protein